MRSIVCVVRCTVHTTERIDVSQNNTAVVLVGPAVSEYAHVRYAPAAQLRLHKVPVVFLTTSYDHPRAFRSVRVERVFAVNDVVFAHLPPCFIAAVATLASAGAFSKIGR